MEYKIMNYSSYDNDPRFVVRTDTGSISNICDRMVRLAAKITESYAGDIFYDIDTLNRSVESGKNYAWLLCLREDGTCLYDIFFHKNESEEIEFDNFIIDGCGIEACIQFWRLSCIDGVVELKRVYLAEQ